MNGHETRNRFKRNPMTWLAYILLALYAYFLNILGPITPFLHDELRLSYTVSSLHFSAFAAGILVVGLVGPVLIQRTGSRQALSIGAIGIGLGAMLLTIGRSPFITIGASFFMGCVGSFILAVVPGWLSDEHGENRAVAISEANLLSSMVSASAALLVGWCANLVVGWRMPLIVAAVISIGFGIRLFQPFGPNSGQVNLHPSKKALPYTYWLFWIAIVLAVAIEFCMIFWSADYMEGVLGMQRTGAVQTISLFLAGMIVGRLISSWVLQCVDAKIVVLTSALFGLLSFTLFWRSANALMGMIGLALTGLFVASLYPILLSIAIGSSNGNTVQAGARATLASGTAILVLPLILGRLADISGLRDAFTIVAILFILLIVLVTISWGIVTTPGTPCDRGSR